MKDLANKIKEEVKYFNFKCPNCGSKNIRIIPLGVSYTNTIVDNNDILNIKFKMGYKKVPHIEDVLKDKDVKKVCDCQDCQVKSSINEELQTVDLRGYLKRNKLEKPMVI